MFTVGMDELAQIIKLDNFNYIALEIVNYTDCILLMSVIPNKPVINPENKIKEILIYI